MAVPHPGLWEKSAASIGSNGSTPSGDFSEIEATIHRLCDARSDDDGNRAALLSDLRGSMTYGNREGIARLGAGRQPPSASSPVLEVYSWQKPDAIYAMMLDVEAIGKERANLVELPNPDPRRR